jgi:hypothetical protein
MYKLIIGPLNRQSVLRLSDGAFIPFDPANTDYAQFKKAVLDGAELQDAEGNTMSAEQATQFVKELP